MPSYTENLKLLKKNPATDGADTFNIQTMLNENWDKVDEAVAKKAELGADGKIPAEQLPAMNYDPAGSAAAVQTNLTNHINNKSNPHGVTLSQIGAAAASHNHSAGNITSGTLPVARGGTGLTASPSLLVNLASTAAANVMTASPRPGVTGILPVARGGTGANSLAALVSQIAANGGCRFEKVVRSGTGTYTEADAPSVTFSFPPKFVFLDQFFGVTNDGTSYAVAMNLVGTTSTPDFGFCENVGNDYYAKKSNDGKTLYWWGEVLWPIFNDIGKTYTLYGLG